MLHDFDICGIPAVFYKVVRCKCKIERYNELTLEIKTFIGKMFFSSSEEQLNSMYSMGLKYLENVQKPSLFSLKV